MAITTTEQNSLVKTVKKFVDNEIRPYIMKWEKETIFPKHILKRMGELGFYGCVFPEKYGGSDAGVLEQVLVVEELSRGSGGIATTNLVQVLTLRPIALAGTETQKERYLKPGIKGDLAAAIAITEPNHGSNVAGVETTAKKQGSGYLLNGSKMFITNGTFADFYLVVAKTDLSAGRKGISLFLVDRDTPGLIVNKKLEKLGWHSSETAELFLEDCWVSEEQLVGEIDKGFYYIMEDFNVERLLLAAESVGLAEEALDLAINYAKERKQFGNPIADFQVIQHKLADMATNVEAGKQLLYNSSELIDKGHVIIKQASMTKYFCSEMVNRVSYDALQIFGGNGYIREFPIERIYRDARILPIGGGTSEIQKNIIAKQILN